MTDSKTATERLRELLDERGVEWKAWDSVHPITVWHDGQFVYEYLERTLLDGVKPYTGEVVDGTGRFEAVAHVCTPEQAIAATLGRGLEKALESLVRDMWQGHDCGAGCAMYEECRHPLDDRCLMAERMKELGIEVIDNER